MKKEKSEEQRMIYQSDVFWKEGFVMPMLVEPITACVKHKVTKQQWMKACEVMWDQCPLFDEWKR